MTATTKGTAQGGRPARRNRGDVVRTAGRLFAERGFHGTSMRDLGDELGLLGSSLYAHIGSKSELLVEIIEQGAALFQALADEVLASGQNPGEQLDALIAGHVRILTDNIELSTTFLNEARHLPEEAHRHVVALRDRYEATFRTVLEAGVTEGVFRKDLNTRYAVTFVLSLLNATVRWYRPGGADGPDVVAHRLRDFVREGIGS